MADAGQLVEGKAIAVEIEGRPVALFRIGEEIYALDNVCPHAGARLDQGRVANGVVSCPLHGAKFELATGRCRTPQIGGERPIATHHVRIAGSRIEVALSAMPVTNPSV